MFIDSLLKVCAAQAFTAAAVSASSIDLGAAAGLGSPSTRQIGTGEPVGFGFNINVASSDTSTLFEVISATDPALTAGILVHNSMTLLNAQTVLGAFFFLGVPPGTPTQRYLGVRITPTGGAATITVSAWLTPQSEFSLLPVTYGKNYVV